MLGWRPLSYSRDPVMHHAETDIPPWPTRPAHLDEIDASPSDVFCRAVDYPTGRLIPPHRHHKHQLINAVRGLMVVTAEQGRWVVPSTRALWMPAGWEHSVRCIGEVHMRSLYIRPEAVAHLPARAAAAVDIGPLLHELIASAVHVQQPYAANSRDGHLMRLLLDELRTLPVLPLHLPEPADPRLRRIARYFETHPDDNAPLPEWGQALGVDARTIQRLCRRELGMSFAQWRQQARLLRALEHLAAGGKVIDVAAAVGYDNASAFTRMFRRHFGVTPGEFFG
ncbi:MAG TPA: helix-turn-helix transcriptional regulator [Stenotrophomonas sp.]|jgi:AraC-like DNA-binding protein